MSLALSSVALLLTGQLGIRLSIADRTDYAFNASQCNSTVTANFQTTLPATTICGPLYLFVTDATSCPNEPAGGDYALAEVPQATLLLNRNQSDARTIDIAKLPFFVKNTADGGTQCGASGIDVTHLLCASVPMGSGFGFDPCANKTFTKATTPVSIRYDTKAPAAPSIASAEGLDSAATVTVGVDSDTDTVDLQYRALPDGEWTFGATVASDMVTAIIYGLENDREYEVRAIARDAAGNESAPSGTATVTPIHSSGFWSACVNAGCPPQGCSATAAGAPLLLAALALAMLRRKTRR